MAATKPRTVPFRRKRDYLTHYGKRLRLLLSRKPRLAVRITNTRLIAQIIGFGEKGDKVLLALDSSALLKLGWKYSLKNIPAAYLSGMLLAKKATSKGLTAAVLDTGSRSLHGKISAFLSGAVAGGLKIPHGDSKLFPPEEKLLGKHVENYAGQLRQKPALYQRHFAQYLKNKAEPDTMSKHVEEIKKMIQKQ